MLTLSLALAVLQAAPAAQPVAGVRSPAYAPDGRLAISVRGDLWLLSPDNRWSRLTSGPEWDRHPTWSRDGRSIFYTSGRDGDLDIWQVAVGSDGTGGTPVRIIATPEPESDPSIDATGRVFFVRGGGSEARIWVRESDGREHRLTIGRAPERWPALSPDSRHIAYVIAAESARRLVVRELSAMRDGRRADTTIVSGPGIRSPAWSPAGDRLTYTIGGNRPGVFVTPLGGRYQNLVTARHAESAWSPDGKRIALTDVRDDVGYNGDPDRVGDREADLIASNGTLSFIDAPIPVDSAIVVQSSLGAPLTAAPDRAAHNASAFDVAWQRTRALYYDATGESGRESGRRSRWDGLRIRYRSRAVAAPDDDSLRAIIHAMMRERPPLRPSATGRAAISSAHPVATAAGLEILRAGGNVVDAAAAVSFAIGVVEPDASGVGGYGEMLVYSTDMSAPRLIEFMTRAPENASLANAERLPHDGPVLANIPGTVAAMHFAWKQYGSGKVAWADILAPAIRAARDGYIVSDGLATTLSTEREHFLKYDGSKALFFRNGKPLVAGDTLKNPDLAWTLEQIASGGADAFYNGEIAKRLVSDLRGKGNAMKLSDMSRYFATEREPVASTYRGYSVYSSAPPVAGGAVLAGMLNNLEQFPNPGIYSEDAATLHAMLSAWLLAPSSRTRIADPGLWPVYLGPFISKDTARARWRCFNPARAPSSAMFRGDTLVCGTDNVDRDTDADDAGHHASGTTAFTVADADGNVVSVTQTNGTWGGNFYVTPGLGFLYNDKLRSYGTDAGAYGARLPFARHGSTIAPTIVFGGSGPTRRPLFALGAAGNNWITSAVYQTLAGMVDQGLDPQAALELPRFYVTRPQNGRGPVIQMEDGFAPAVMKRLAALGYRIELVSLIGELREGYGAAVMMKNGRVTAGADPRRNGAAGALPF